MFFNNFPNKLQSSFLGHMLKVMNICSANLIFKSWIQMKLCQFNCANNFKIQRGKLCLLFTLTFWMPLGLKVYLSTWLVACAGCALLSGTESWFCWSAPINGTAARPALRGTDSATGAANENSLNRIKLIWSWRRALGPNPQQLSARKHDRPWFGLIAL